jgi:hypothetical protein
MKLKHYSETHRWSHIHNAWIFKDSWNDAEEIARLNKQVFELQNELDARTQQLEFARAILKKASDI